MAGIWLNRRRRAKPPNFAMVVVGIAIAAFALTGWWPNLTTNSPIVALPSLASAQSAGPAEPTPATDQSANASFSAANSGDRFACRVASVTDGDTFRCTDGTRVRLHAVAARETDETCSIGHPCPFASAAAAKAELQSIAGGRSLSCSPTGRSYDRVTAICWTLEGREVNCAMVRSRTAVVWERFHREQPICRG